MSPDLDIEKYAARHHQFLTDWLPPLLERIAVPGRIVDLGCGDGATIWALHRRGLLGDITWAVDLSSTRVEAAISVAPGVIGVVADAASVPLEDGCADGVVCSQVVEHVSDEQALAAEIARLLRPGGWWYVGTVLRGPRAWWIYKVDGVRRLDPTHEREYENMRELRAALDTPGLVLDTVVSTPLRFPVSDLVIRAAGRGRQISRAYERLPQSIRRVRVRVPGYHLLEAAGTKSA